MKVYAVVLGLAVLFISGSVTSEMVMRRREGVSQSPSRSSSRLDYSRQDEVNASKTEDAARAGSSRAAEARASKGDDTAARSDIIAAAESPRTHPSRNVDSDSAARFLSENFGPALAPQSAAGFRISKPVEGDESRITAVYAGATDTSCDLLQLVVVRAKDGAEAAKIVRGHAGLFPQLPTAYSWGGRRIVQGMTQEDKPATFPPALSFSWSRDRYAIQVTAVPVAPASVKKARDSSLRLIAALQY